MYIYVDVWQRGQERGERGGEKRVAGQWGSDPLSPGPRSIKGQRVYPDRSAIIFRGYKGTMSHTYTMQCSEGEDGAT